MPLAPGDTLGSYEILAPLGAGGMGAVYRARDRKLGRDVALKILPPAFATDVERLARFEREARTLAAINHPNIAQVYDASSRGADPAYLVMELVAGEDLSAHIARGPMPIDEVIHLATQMALALEAAHDLGIIHRDLKPANVKRRDDGTIKILDFGLAKALDPAASLDPGGSIANSPTVTSPARLRQGYGEAGTAVGMILGTAAYMSPEQARGHAVDKRTDIWAFGVVIFELLTGKPLFQGETISDTLAAVLRQEIPWTALPADTPAHLLRVLRRCLERDPRRRLRDLGEARHALEHPEEPMPPTVSSGAIASPTPTTAWTRRAVVAVPWMLLVALGAFTLWRGSAEDVATTGVLRAVLPHDDAGAIAGRIVITPDGRNVVFVAIRDGIRRLVVRSLDRFEHRVLAGTHGAEGPFLSPDGRWIGFFSGTRLKRVPLAGGTVEDLAEVSLVLLRAASWTTRGEIITHQAARLVRVPERGGVPVPIRDTAGEEIRGAWALASPSGRHVVFMQGGPGEIEDDFLHVVSLETGAIQKTTFVTRDNVAMLADHCLFRREDGALMAVRFDDDAGQIVGDPFQVLEASATAAVSPAGTAVYVADDQRATLTMREGTASRPVWPLPWPIRELRVSPTGHAVAVIRDSRPPEVWVYEFATATPTKIADQGYRPIWTDRKGMAYFRWLPGFQPTRELFARPSDASVTETRLFGSETLRLEGAQMTADGTQVLLTARDEGGNTLFLAPVGANGTPKPLLEREPGLSHVRLSADGTWIVYSATSSGAREVYARPLIGAAGRITVSTGGGTLPVWSADGRGVYYRQGDSFVLATLERTPAARVVKRETVLTGDFVRRDYGSYDVMPGAAGRLLVLEPVPGSTRLVVVHNWMAELRDRLATSPR